jgi:serine/threonine protein kinase
MTQPPNPKTGHPPSERPRDPNKQEETILLSEIPDASSMVPDTPAPASSGLNLTSTSLEALSARYEILAEAGRGSMGNVYKARDRETGETVALKILKPEVASDQAMMDRFKNELLFARKITHKNVCRVHDFNRIGGISCISMEFVEGESLRSVLNRFGGLPLRKGFDVALQICSGLKEAHAQGIVHRDLKPENVMIDERGNVKIMDFGIARSMEAGTRLTGTMVGTPAYMAPEQVAGKQVDYRTDIYSLGLMLYEVFTGSQAFQADTPVAVALKQLRDAPPPPHQVDPSIPVGLERTILKCLEKDPAKRFQSVADLENRLRPAGGTPAAAAGLAVSHSSPLPRSVSYAAPAEKRERKRASPILWILLGAALVLAAPTGLRWFAAAKAAATIPPPAPFPAPTPPDFALDVPGSQTAASEPAKTDQQQPVDSTGQIEPKSPPAATTDLTPADSTSSAKAATPVDSTPVAKAPPLGEHASSNKSAKSLEPAPDDVQQRAEKAFGESGSANKSGDQTYLWVGRYPREEGAQSAAKKIEGLGLPVTIIPRHGPGGDFYVVFTGPFGEKRVPDVMQWLETQGFVNVHSVKAPGQNQQRTKQPE